MITRCINAACDEVTFLAALGTLVDACEKLDLTLEFGVEQDPICSVNFHGSGDEYLFTGADSAEMKALTVAFYLCCYIRCVDGDAGFVDLDGSWRRLVARFALTALEAESPVVASENTKELDNEEALATLVRTIKGKYAS